MRFKSDKQRKAVMAKIMQSSFLRPIPVVMQPNTINRLNSRWRNAKIENKQEIADEIRHKKWLAWKEAPAKLYLNDMSIVEYEYREDPRYDVKIKWMSPDDFLDMTYRESIQNGAIQTYSEYLKSIRDENKIKRIKKYLNAGNKVNRPEVTLSKNKNSTQYHSHEGRHRAMVLKEKGITYMPVSIYRRKKYVKKRVYKENKKMKEFRLRGFKNE
jgi:hypothetical protein